MKHTVSISLSTYTKLFVTNKKLDSIKVELSPVSNSSEVTTKTFSAENHCSFENVEPGQYNLKAYSVDSDGNVFGEELSGVINVQDGIEAPGQYVEPKNWVSYQRLSVSPSEEVNNIELPSLMQIIVT
jgi:hypothetical protein